MRCARGILAVLAVTCALSPPRPAAAQASKPTYGAATVLEFPDRHARGGDGGDRGRRQHRSRQHLVQPRQRRGARACVSARILLGLVPYRLGAQHGECRRQLERLPGSRPLAFGVDFSAGKFGAHSEILTIFLPEGTGETDPAEYFWSLTGGAGVVLDDRWEVRVGAAAKRYWISDIDRDGFGFDAGTTVAYRAVASEWQVTPAAAVAFVNLGTTLQETDSYILKLPARFNYGLSVRIESPPVRVFDASVPLLAMTCNLDGVDRFYGQESSWSFGSEFALADILFLRAGTIHDETLHEWRSAVSGFSSLGVGLGVPIQSFRLRFDYARMPRLIFPDRYGLYAVVSF